MKNKYPKILEITWLIVAIFGALVSIHSTINSGFKKSLFLYAITLFSFFVYLIRHSARKKN
jgi:hypothetical protein